jgi:MOSC domain-containing protein YiiM
LKFRERLSDVKVISVNVSTAQIRLIGGRRVATAIGKRPVPGPVDVGPLGLAGDEQADLAVHGGLRKALYTYGTQHLPFWQTVRAQARVSLWDEPLPFGAVGENLSIEGLDETRLWLGDRLVLPHCVLQVTEPRQPCFKFNAAMGFEHAARLMWQSGYCGCYLSVVQGGTVSAGEAVELQPGAREIGLLELFRTRQQRQGF